MTKIIMIEWMDVMSVDLGLFTIEDLESIKPAHAFIVGFLVKETTEAYYIAKERWETEQYKYLHVVPKDTTIIEVTELQEMKD